MEWEATLCLSEGTCVRYLNPASHQLPRSLDYQAQLTILRKAVHVLGSADSTQSVERYALDRVLALSATY